MNILKLCKALKVLLQLFCGDVKFVLFTWPLTVRPEAIFGFGSGISHDTQHWVLNWFKTYMNRSHGIPSFSKLRVVQWGTWIGLEFTWTLVKRYLLSQSSCIVQWGTWISLELAHGIPSFPNLPCPFLMGTLRDISLFVNCVSVLVEKKPIRTCSLHRQHMVNFFKLTEVL
jgi:hypothetical protein